jgi:hypothetical protein
MKGTEVDMNDELIKDLATGAKSIEDFSSFELQTMIGTLASRLIDAESALDQAEIAGGLTENGNLWRFWSQKARDYIASCNKERDELSARVKLLEETGSALIADIKRRHPGEELRCQYMRAIDAALQDQTNAD